MRPRRRRFASAGRRSSDRAATTLSTIVGAGVTVFEALKAAADQLQKEGISAPRHRRVFGAAHRRRDAARRRESHTRRGHTVEDHYAPGGLGDAVAEALAPLAVPVTRLAVREIPRSGQPEELLDRYGISARHIVEAVKQGTTKAVLR